MNLTKKPAAVREKELRLAILRIEHGRSKFQQQKLSISSVAREAEVSPALIHNHYPKIAEVIRTKLLKSGRAQLEKKQCALRNMREDMKKTIEDLKIARVQIDSLVSINEKLLLENRMLRNVVTTPNVSVLISTSKPS